MNKQKFVVTIVIVSCVIFSICGCQNENQKNSQNNAQNNYEPQSYWYYPDDGYRQCIYQCKSDWTSGLSCDDFNNDCMYAKGYKLYKREELPPNILTWDITDTDSDIKKYGVAGYNSDTVKRLYIEKHPEISTQIKNAILNSNIVKGMTQQELIIAKAFYNSGTSWVWTKVMHTSDYDILEYNRYHFTFSDGKLIDWVEYGF